MSYTCYLETCQAKESLPFKCQDCNNYFCRKHCSYDKHNCSTQNKLYRYIPESDLQEILLCSFQGCRYDKDNKSNLCDKCDNNFCNKHRHPWHKCNKSTHKNVSWWEKIKSCFQKS
jgi:predicted nucleic acid binding AN1-type Zn finger protein